MTFARAVPYTSPPRDIGVDRASLDETTGSDAAAMVGDPDKTQHDPPQHDTDDFKTPHDLDVEQLVLGYLLTHPDQAGHVLPELSPDHFFRVAHQAVFRAMLAVQASGAAIDLFAVRAELDRMGVLDDVGGVAALAALDSGIPRSATIDSGVADLREIAYRRDVARVTYAISRQAQAGQEPSALVEGLNAQLADIEARHTADTKPTLRSFADGLTDALAWIVTHHDGRKFIGLATGTLPILDRRTLGLRGLIVLAAQPGIGKTSFGLDVGLATINHHTGDPLGPACFIFCSFEMSRPAMVLRMLSGATALSWERLVLGDHTERLTKDGFDLGQAGLDQFRSGVRQLRAIGDKIVLIDSDDLPRGLTRPADWLRHVIDDAKKTTATERAFVLIDNLQSIPVSNDPASGRAWRTDLDRDRFLMAELLAVSRSMPDDPLFVISEQAKGRFATADLDSVLGSGRSVYSPDVVLFLRGDPNIDDTLPTSDAIDLDLIVSKARDGMQRGPIPLTFHYRTSTYEEANRVPFSTKKQQNGKP